MEKEKVQCILLNKEYYSINDLRYNQKVGILFSKDEFEEFYQKVKKLLDSEGEVSNAIGRLTDKEKFNSLSYDEKQRYTLNLSEKYLQAVERYKKEKSLMISR